MSCVLRADTRRELHVRFGHLAAQRVRRANDGAVRDGRVREQHLLDLGRIDVHARGDDQLAVAADEEQVTGFVDVATIADGDELAAAAGRRLRGVAEVLKAIARVAASGRSSRSRTGRARGRARRES